jgi:hypothetical protein
MSLVAEMQCAGVRQSWAIAVAELQSDKVQASATRWIQIDLYGNMPYN